MGRVKAQLQLPGVATSDAEELWYDTRRWPTFVDGLGHVFKVDEGWPRAPGAVAIWDSKPGGRGRVLERVVSFEARVGQTVEVEDEKIHGRQTIALPAERRRHHRDPRAATTPSSKTAAFLAVVDFLFVRRPMRDSLKRTLARFEREARAPALDL